MKRVFGATHQTIPPEELLWTLFFFNSASFLHRGNGRRIDQRLRLGKESLVLEIASMTGRASMSPVFRFGRDPPRISRVGEQPRHTYYSEFYHAFAIHLKEHERVTADLVFGANVLAHAKY